MTNVEKAVLGALGGLSAVLVKFLGQDYGNVVAPAMITTWSGGNKGEQIAFNDVFVTRAYAQTADTAQKSYAPANPDATTKSTWEQIQSGVGTFFGYGKEPQKYGVIVGDYAYLSEARKLKDKALATQTVKDAYLSTGERR